LQSADLEPRVVGDCVRHTVLWIVCKFIAQTVLQYDTVSVFFPGQRPRHENRSGVSVWKCYICWATRGFCWQKCELIVRPCSRVKSQLTLTSQATRGCHYRVAKSLFLTISIIENVN
jgi:hypothetical protein